MRTQDRLHLFGWDGKSVSDLRRHLQQAHRVTLPPGRSGDWAYLKDLHKMAHELPPDPDDPARKLARHILKQRKNL